MPEVVITSIEGRHLDLSRGEDEGEPWTFTARLVTEHGDVVSFVCNYLSNPSTFFRSLAADWRGWEGERSWNSLERELDITALHDGKGLIACEVSLGSNIPPTWRLAAEMTFGAGAHMEEIASALEAAGL
jgi:predicted oxidoreductase (fatty acid repression mutant protein)